MEGGPGIDAVKVAGQLWRQIRLDHPARGDWERTIRIAAIGQNRTHNTVSTVSRVSDHGDRAGLNHPPPGLEQAL